LIGRGRALVVADGFYEWKRVGKKKQPYFAHLASRRPIFFAALSDTWIGPSGPVETCTIVTRPASAELEAIHDRMPVILDREGRARWLAPRPEPWPTLRKSLLEQDPPVLEVYPVSTRVNKPGNDDPSNVARIDPRAC
jgi:putative SOS response-associated peptidase YedK